MEQDNLITSYEIHNGATHVVAKTGLTPLRTFSLRRFDFVLLVLSLSVTGFGILAIGSAESQLALRQLAGAAVSLLVLLFLSAFDYHVLLKLYVPIYVTMIILLISVLLFGSTGGGAQRWVNIAGIRFQPSESAKLMLILFFSQFIMRHKDRMYSFSTIFFSILLILPPLYLVEEEPDLSTTIMLFVIYCVMMFVGGISWKLVISVFAVAIPTIAVGFNMVLQEGQQILDEYQQGRILAWLHPELYENSLAYQTMNSIMAIGSGQLMGKGYNTNRISSVLNSGYISESQTDFIFTVVGEEFGFLGSCLLIVLLILIAVRCLHIASKASDFCGCLLAAGVGCWIGFQSFMNIGVATGVLPNTGIPLPFVSYGLTSLVSLFAAIGIVLNVSMQSRIR